MQKNEILETMLKLQQKLNDETNGPGWENGFTKEGKLISFRRCVYMECAELMDSFAWKHWKNIRVSTNWENVRTELVDIWHFILSIVLETYHSKHNKDFSFMVMELSSINVFKDFCKEASVAQENDIYGILNDIELIIHKCSGFGFDLCELLSAYFTLAIKCGLNLEILYKGYVGKNVLNAFRQDNGYKEGLYKKRWNDKEDNEVLNEILKKELSYEAIYQSLKKRYEELL